MVNATVERRRVKSDLSARRRHVRYPYRTWMKSFLTDELEVKTMKFISSPNPNTQIIGSHTNRSLFFLGLVKDKVDAPVHEDADRVQDRHQWSYFYDILVEV